ncbi:MAG: malate synthase [Blastocatellia bacterium]|nr:malate synthase [Blastocatellia bacterium]
METGTICVTEPEHMKMIVLASGVGIHEPAWTPQAQSLLTSEWVGLLAKIHRELAPQRKTLLAARQERQARYDAGELPAFLPADSEAVTGTWQVAPIPADLKKRRVEITGPINSTKMVINMLSRNGEGDRADTAMLDFEDSMKPSWENVIQGLHNLIGAAAGTLSLVQPAVGNQPEKVYALDPNDMPVVMVRVRGLHLDEANVVIDGEPVAGGLFDFVLSMAHSAKILLAQGKTPKYYVPKCEHYLEARWWNQLFTLVQQELGLPVGTIRATFLIETLPAAFQMEEILYEIREHAAGLNVGRWDKIFSDIKVLKNHPDRILADRASIGLNRPWMKNYALRLIKICHSRGAFAMGGMAAFTPGKTAELRREQTNKVREDKELEAGMGHDGCWVSHPYFIGVAMSAFTRDNQLDALLPEFDKYPDLLPQATGPKTLAGLRKNIRVGIAYLQGWQQDIGCVAWDNLMEDLATLEISRAQTWQWLRHRVTLDDGSVVTPELATQIFDEEFARITNEIQEEMNGLPKEKIENTLKEFSQARRDAERLFLQETFQDFLATTSDLA